MLISAATLVACVVLMLAVVWFTRAPAVREADVARDWVAVRGDASIHIAADGTFTSERFPFREQFPELLAVPEEHGTWQLMPQGLGHPHATVQLRFVRTSGGDHGVPLVVEPRDGSPRLFFWRGDPDSHDRYEFMPRT